MKLLLDEITTPEVITTFVLFDNVVAIPPAMIIIDLHRNRKQRQ